MRETNNGKTFTILLAGVTAGILDAMAAMISYMIKIPGVNPAKVWRFVASGALGQDALSQDLLPMAMIGLLFHFVIAFLFAVFFFFIYPRIKWIWRNLVVTGLIYGVFVWIVMNLIVVPLSRVPAKSKLWAITNGQFHFQFPTNPKQLIIGLLIIMFCIGLPISMIVGKFYKKHNLYPKPQS
jgi:hypothetical protein